MARRQVDDQAADLAVKNRGQFRGDDLDMPAEKERGLRIELTKGAARKARKIALQQAAVPHFGYRRVHCSFTTETRSSRRAFSSRVFLLRLNMQSVDA